MRVFALSAQSDSESLGFSLISFVNIRRGEIAASVIQQNHRNHTRLL